MILILEFLGFFAFFVVFGYLAPAGRYYWSYHRREKPEYEKLRIQPHRRPTREQIMREVRMSLISLAIFAALGTVVFQFYKAGWTSIYLNLFDYPLIYFPISVFFCMVIHDTYFYWTHRFMHWRPIFKYMHLGHHRSVSPTPWAIYAFQPAEAITQFAIVAAMILVIPLHPMALMMFLWLDTQMNAGGHTGVELIPESLAKHPLFLGINTVTHHDSHHTNMGKNFGSFFNVWDRWMGTFLDNSTPSTASDECAMATEVEIESAAGSSEKNVAPARGRGLSIFPPTVLAPQEGGAHSAHG